MCRHRADEREVLDTQAARTPDAGVPSHPHADRLYRFFGRNHFGGVVGTSAHMFADGVDIAAQEAAGKAWPDGVYA